MERVTVIVTYKEGETRHEQLCVLPIDKSDGTGRPKPALAIVCLLQSGPVDLIGGRAAATYIFDPEDPRQIRAERIQTVQTELPAPPPIRIVTDGDTSVDDVELHAARAADECVDDARPGAV